MASRKGGNWERETSRLLSLWWTKGKRDDCFWRVKGSGGRATVRGRSGLGTRNQYGDICATDNDGLPLTDFLTIELKRGYSKFTIQDLLDRSPRQGKWQTYWDQWFQQTITSAAGAASFAWLMIVKRDYREAMVFMPWRLTTILKEAGCFYDKPVPFATFVFELRFKEGGKFTNSFHKVSCMHRDKFLSCVTPDVIKRLARFN